VEAKEDLLYQILSLAGIAQDAAADRKREAVVAAEEGKKSFLIPILNEFKKFFVRRRRVLKSY
jgi:hypothetical protein